MPLFGPSKAEKVREHAEKERLAKEQAAEKERLEQAEKERLATAQAGVCAECGATGQGTGRTRGVYRYESRADHES